MEWLGLGSGGQHYAVGEHVLLFLYPLSKFRLSSAVGGERWDGSNSTRREESCPPDSKLLLSSQIRSSLGRTIAHRFQRFFPSAAPVGCRVGAGMNVNLTTVNPMMAKTSALCHVRSLVSRLAIAMAIIFFHSSVSRSGA